MASARSPGNQRTTATRADASACERLSPRMVKVPAAGFTVATVPDSQGSRCASPSCGGG
jgi:hypothetical protein